MKIKFLGAAGTVTGSSYLLTSGSGQSILIDLGMFQGPDVDHLNFEPFDCDPSTLSAVILTHAHLDHCGRLPILLKKGFASPIWMTSETADLTELSLMDTAKIAKQDERKPLFDEAGALQTIKLFQRVHYRTPTVIGDFTVTLRDAGHILGAAFVEITDSKPESGIKKIVFSGDLGNSPDDLLHETETIPSTDAVVMESTYGDRLHPASDPAATIAAEFNAVEKSGGTLLIPAFSLHRTQALMHIIMHLKEKGTIRGETPVYMDSPMGNTATDIYSRYPEDFNDHVKEEFTDGGPFEFPGRVLVGRGSEQHAMDKIPGTKVIIAGSGMMTGGRIVRLAAQYLPMPTTRLLIVGYQGVRTLGRALLEGSRTVTIEGRTVKVLATVTDTQAMSAHADQQQLMDWLTPITGVQKVLLTHGDDGPRQALAEKITKDLRISDVHLPKMHEEVSL